ncbi:MAG: adenosylcobinamide-phosphate synthase CbiB [Pseudomonadota bacterium]
MLALAMILDALIGEPRVLWSRVPHPVVAIGRLINWLERRLNRGTARRGKGVLALGVVLMAVLPLPLLLWWLPYAWPLEVVGAAILLAHRSLVQHVGDVARGLSASLEEGRARVAMIVGRDPNRLDQSGVARAAIESAAENFSDGVVAPAFWFAVAGLPGIAVYKAVNTADSMIGYLSPRFSEFGWASARLDDALNLIPARLTGALFCIVGLRRAAWRIMWKDAGLHRSPNAGWPEAALAGSLDLAIAGPRVYPDRVVDDPYLNEEGRHDIGPADIERAIQLLWRAWGLMLALAFVSVAWLVL